jgi:hypothetical protein
LIILDIESVRSLRSIYPKLDKIIGEIENTIDNNGAPKCDFKLYRPLKYRNKFQIFRNGVRRAVALNRKTRMLSGGEAYRDILQRIKDD